MEENVSVRIDEAWHNDLGSKVYVTGLDGLVRSGISLKDIGNSARLGVDLYRYILPESLGLGVKEKTCVQGDDPGRHAGGVRNSCADELQEEREGADETVFPPVAGWKVQLAAS